VKRPSPETELRGAEKASGQTGPLVGPNAKGLHDHEDAASKGNAIVPPIQRNGATPLRRGMRRPRTTPRSPSEDARAGADTIRRTTERKRKGCSDCMNIAFESIESVW
jgi:hypothetical protein